MINIHKQLWVVKGVNRKVEDSEFLLAYMTHREYTKDKEETVAFTKRKSTGTLWATYRKWSRELRKHEATKEGNTLEFDNSPASGFRIVGSVSRWSTSNKLIRVEDPRGFVVEIPTGNLTTLLKHTTVEEGEIKEECVWGKEGNNHILLSINSDIYQKSYNQTQQNKEKVSLTKLKIGQTVKFNVEDEEYIYLGRGKAVWKVCKKESQTTTKNWFHRHCFTRDTNDPIIETYNVEDTKLGFLFKKKDMKSGFSSNWEYKISGKCIVIGEIEKLPKLEVFDVYTPERLCTEIPRDDYSKSFKVYYTAETVDFNMKGKSK